MNLLYDMKRFPCGATMKTMIRAFASICLALAVAGCSTTLAPDGPYRGNKSLYATDSAITAAFGVLDAFMVFQSANRAALPADVNAFADRTRRDAPQWSQSIIALRDVYAASPTPENKLALDKILKLVREAVVQASVYILPPNTP